MPAASDPLRDALGLEQAGDLDRAEQAFRQILSAQPNHADALHWLGVIALKRVKPAEAIQWISQAIRFQGSRPAFHNNLGEAYRSIGQFDLARACYRRALELDPAMAAAHHHWALVCQACGQETEAQHHFGEALRLKTGHAETDPFSLYDETAEKLQLQGRAREAIDYFRKAVELRPSNATAHRHLLYALNFCEGYDPQTVFEEHLAWAERHAEPLSAAAPPVTNDPTPERRLRIGYVSPYFRHHAVNYFVEPILLAHDHAQFEVFCYSDVRRADDVTERIRASADHWRDTRALSDEQIAQQVRDDAIDILVDLTGHIGGSRLLVFARKPAPVQVTYIGYQNTTGMTAMDYRLTDAHADPPGLTDGYYTEKLVRLEPLFFCYRPLPDAPAVNPLSAASNGYITFGSFNNFMKVSDRVLDTWLEILARVPRSRLLVLSYREGYVEEHLRAMAAAKGISGERIELFNKMPTDEFLRLQQRADIALDPFPFNGHTTTCDSLWLGLPVVMLEGQTYASRFGGSALVTLGLDAWITRSTDEYIDCAVKLASDLGALARWRAELRPRMAHSALLDHPGFTRRLEAAYRRMWLDWCRTRSTMT